MENSLFRLEHLDDLLLPVCVHNSVESFSEIALYCFLEGDAKKLSKYLVKMLLFRYHSYLLKGNLYLFLLGFRLFVLFVFFSSINSMREDMSHILVLILINN